MIKAIIFDIGGVLVTDVTRELREYLADKLELSYSRVSKAFFQRWPEYKTAAIGADEFWEAFSRDLGVNLDVGQLQPISNSMIREIDDMLTFARALKRKYKLGIISNNTNVWDRYARTTFHLEEIFDAILTSNEFKKPKPDKEIYEACLEKLDVKPAEAIFIDDKEENISAAKELGMGAIHFENPEQLKEALGKMGVFADADYQA